MADKNRHSQRAEPFFSEGAAAGQADGAPKPEAGELPAAEPADAAGQPPASSPQADKVSAGAAAGGDSAARAAAEQKLAAADQRIARLEAELAELKDQSLRALAEAENTRRRARKEVEDTAKYAIANLAKDLLSAPDNLRRALDNIPAEGRKNDELLERLAAGVELVERELLVIFERYGIKRIEALGQPFDHNLHQALFEVPTADQPPGTVVQVLVPGYVIQDRLLRPAMVGVAKAPTAASGEGSSGGEAGQRVDTTV